jgi:hypothetical protein
VRGAMVSGRLLKSGRARGRSASEFASGGNTAGTAIHDTTDKLERLVLSPMSNRTEPILQLGHLGARVARELVLEPERVVFALRAGSAIILWQRAKVAAGWDALRLFTR